MDSNCDARQPLALTLPLNSLGGRHAPLAARVLAYTSSLKRKTGQCRVVALSVENQCPLQRRLLMLWTTPPPGARAPWMWVLLRPPRFGEPSYASGHDNWSRHREVGLIPAHFLTMSTAITTTGPVPRFSSQCRVRKPTATACPTWCSSAPTPSGYSVIVPS